MHEPPPDDVYDPAPGNLDPATLDTERLSALIELGLAIHPDRLRVDRFLRAGAEFICYPVEDGEVTIMLAMTPQSPGFAAMRAKVSGGEIGLLDASEYSEQVLISKAPLSALKKPNQG